MSIAFEVAIGRSRTVRLAILAAHLTGAIGVGTLALMLVRDQSQSAAALALLIGVPSVLLSWRRALAGLAQGRLRVSADGAARWQPPDGPDFAIDALRWHRIGAFAWIQARSGERRVRLLLGRDQLGDSCWRCLLVWLRWMDRGGGAPVAGER